MKNAKEFKTGHPVRFYEHKGQKLIVDGHHRTEAARNLGHKVWAKPVSESFFQQKWGKTTQDFLKKAKDYAKKLK